MKQIMLNSKLDLPALLGFVVSTGSTQERVKEGTRLKSTVLTAGAANYSGVKGATTVLGPSFRKWLSSVARATLIGTLAISGCTSKDSGDYSNRQHKQMPEQQRENATTNPVHKEVGEASWYGPGLQGQETANGETFDQKNMTAAHPSLPMGTEAKVTNLENGKKVEVRINDRGPFAEDRVIDLSNAAAKKLDMKKDGTTQVKIETKPTKKKVSAKPPSKTKLTAKKRHSLAR